MSALAYSGLGELYQRRISKAQVSQWERTRNAYERESRKRQAAVLIAQMSYPIRPAKEVLPEAPKRIPGICWCGCGQKVSSHSAMWARGHRPLYGDRPLRAKEIAEQLDRIPDTEMGRLAKIVLLRELNRGE